MTKNRIIIVLLIMLSIGVISLYTTFGYEGDNTLLNELSESDYNLMHSLKNNTNQEVIIKAKEEKFIDITLKNTYDATIRYGMYYYLLTPDKLPQGVTIDLADESEDLLENTIKPGNTRIVSIKITNNSEYSIDLIIGALIGYENGDISDLVTDGEVLIK